MPVPVVHEHVDKTRLEIRARIDLLARVRIEESRRLSLSMISTAPAKSSGAVRTLG